MTSLQLVEAYPKILRENENLKSQNKELKNELKHKNRLMNTELGEACFDLMTENIIVIDSPKIPNYWSHTIARPLYKIKPWDYRDMDTVLGVENILVNLEPVYEDLGYMRLFHGMMGKCEITGKIFIWYNPNPLCCGTSPVW